MIDSKDFEKMLAWVQSPDRSTSLVVCRYKFFNLKRSLPSIDAEIAVTIKNAENDSHAYFSEDSFTQSFTDNEAIVDNLHIILKRLRNRSNDYYVSGNMEIETLLKRAKSKISL